MSRESGRISRRLVGRFLNSAFGLGGCVALGIPAALGLNIGLAESARAASFFGLFGSDEQPPAPTPETLPYQVEFNAGESATAGILRDTSDLYRLRLEPPPNGDGLARRVEADLPRLLDALWGEGYYDASIRAVVAGQTIDMSGKGRDSAALAADKLRGAALVPVKIEVTPGAQFKLRTLRILDDRTGAPFPNDVLPMARIKLDPGDPARAGALRAVESQAVDLLRSRSYALARVVKSEPVVQHTSDVVDLTIRVDAGPKAGIGKIDITGTETVDPAVVRSFIYLEEDEPYTPEKIAAMRKSIASVEIVGSARILEAEKLNPQGNLPMTVQIGERKQHLVAAAAQYSTVDGPSVRAAWTDRNLFGGGERLRLESSVGLSNASGGKTTNPNWLDPDHLVGRVGASFIKPGLYGTRNDLLADLYVAREVTPGYTSSFVNGSTAIRHRFDEAFYVQGGFEFERGRASDPFGTTDYTLVGVPVSARYDTTDNPLDPTRGVRVIASAAGYSKALGSTVNLLQAKAQASAYYSFDEEARTVLAGRVALGSLAGATIGQIPSSRRFFAGGGGSVRGFAHRSLSPLGPGGIPIGGLSLFEASLEARIKITDTIGIVPFVDAGSAFATSTPEFGKNMRFSAGLGLRYYTGFGPIRLDVATPIGRRAGEKPVAVYVSVGQSF